jgi:hypothetical protein
LPKGAEVLPDYNQAVRDMVMANALAPLRQLPVGTVAGKPYDDEKVIEKLNEANVIAKKHFTSFEREKANRRYSEFKNKRPKNRVS